MTGVVVARTGAALLALVAGRGAEPWRLFATGLLAGVAVLGISPSAFPEPRAAGLAGAALGGLLALVYWRVWPPLVSHAAAATGLLALPLASLAALLTGSRGSGTALLASATALGAASVFGASGCQANAEAGWRRSLCWLLAALGPAGLAAGAALLASRFPAGAHASLAVGAALAAGAVWVPASALEWYRTRRELQEEVRLALLPAEDVSVLSVPWRRFLEPRFGRRDERKQYVKSALLLAVALQQQRRRTGEPARLRQLELLTFRTRLRRTLAARQARWAGAEVLPEPLEDEAAGPARRAAGDDDVY